MTSHAPRKTSLLIALAAAGVLAAAGPAQAAYIMTPLRLSASETQVDVGDTVTLTVSAENETTARAWAGKTVAARYGYDASERPANEEQGQEDPDAPTSDASWQKRDVQPQLALDGNAHARLAWTIPGEARDHNVVLTVESAEGEVLATARLAVGNAPPVMYATGAPGGSDDGREIGETPADGAGDGATGLRDAQRVDDGPARALAFVGIGAVGVAVAVALVVGIARKP